MNERCVLRLYVVGMTEKSATAIQKLTDICDKHMQGLCDLTVIDLFLNPKLAKDEKIFAIPILLKELPLPIRELIRNMSETKKYLVGIDFYEKEDS